MSVAGVAAGVGAAAAVAGAAIQAKSAKKAANAAQAGNEKAAGLSAEAAEKANAVALETKWSDLERQTALQQASIKGMDPYAKAGVSAQDKLNYAMGLVPDTQRSNKAAAAKEKATSEAQKEINAFKKATGQTADDAVNKLLKSKPEWKTLTKEQKATAITQVKTEWNNQINMLRGLRNDAGTAAFNEANVRSQGYNQLNQNFGNEQFMADPRSGGQAAPNLLQNFDQNAYLAQGGLTQGDLIRGFSAQDYSANPMTGGNAPVDLTQNFNRDAFLAQNNQTQADTFRAFTNQDFKNSPISGGRDAPDLMANFDESQFLKDAGGTGVVGKDLTQNFDREAYLAESGRSLSDLNAAYDSRGVLGGRDISTLTQGYGGSDWDSKLSGSWDGGGYDEAAMTAAFDPNAYLQQGGRSLNDMMAKYDPKDFLGAGGRNLGDLTRAYDPNGFLAAGGHDIGDLTRDFTMADYQEDPGYAVRLAQGNKGF